MKKLSFVLVALAAFVLFAGCANGTENNNNNNGGYSTTQEQAVFVGTQSSGGTQVATYTWTFKTDGTWVGMSKSHQLPASEPATEYLNGTYLGNAAKDGKIKITIKKMFDGTSLADYTGSRATFETTITNGKLSYGGVELTRQ